MDDLDSATLESLANWAEKRLRDHDRTAGFGPFVTAVRDTRRRVYAEVSEHIRSLIRDRSEGEERRG